MQAESFGDDCTAESSRWPPPHAPATLKPRSRHTAIPLRPHRFPVIPFCPLTISFQHLRHGFEPQQPCVILRQLLSLPHTFRHVTNACPLHLPSFLMSGRPLSPACTGLQQRPLPALGLLFHVIPHLLGSLSFPNETPSSHQALQGAILPPTGRRGDWWSGDLENRLCLAPYSPPFS